MHVVTPKSKEMVLGVVFKRKAATADYVHKRD